MYLIVYPGGMVLATTLEVALGFFEGINERPMRASAVPGEYAYEVFPDFPGKGWFPAKRSIANLGRQKPEIEPVPPVFPFKISEEWGTDD